MLRDDFLVKQLRRLLEQLATAVGLLDKGQLPEAAVEAQAVVDDITSACGEDWQRLAPRTLLMVIGDEERARALARGLWIVSAADEAAGRYELARARGRRAMELYARVRLGPERLDVRAARELAGASGRLRKRADG